MGAFAFAAIAAYHGPDTPLMHPSILISRPARVVALGLLLACPVWGATTIYMSIGAAHAAGTLRFPILSYERLIQPANHGSASGRGSEQERVGGLKITKPTGTESPMLHQMAASGRHLPEVVIEFYRSVPHGDPELYLTIKLTSAMITNVRELAGHGATSQLQNVEEVTVEAEKINWKYTQQSAKENPLERSLPSRVQH